MPTAPTHVRAFLEASADGGNPFLRSVHNSMVEWDGSLTESQIATVQRIMVERGWTRNEAGVWIAPAQGETPDTSVGEPASHNDATNIPNGRFQIHLEPTVRSDTGDYEYDDSVDDPEPHHFWVRTITQTRTDSLRHKRVIAWLSNEGEWENFAYLTTTGRVKVWRRFQDRSTEPWQIAAHQLLLMLRTGMRTDTTNRMETDALGNNWNLTVLQRRCRYCNDSLSRYEFPIGHDSCSLANRHMPDSVENPNLNQPRWCGSCQNYHPLGQHTAASIGERVRAANEVRAAQASAIQRPELSELGTGWER